MSVPSLYSHSFSLSLSLSPPLCVCFPPCILTHSFSLPRRIRYETKLYLTNHRALCTALFFQETLRHFGGLDPIAISPPAPLVPLLLLALDDPDSDWRPEDGTKEELAELAANLLAEKGAMLKEYFAIDITRHPSAQPGVGDTPLSQSESESQPDASPGDRDFESESSQEAGSSQPSSGGGRGGIVVLASLPRLVDHHAPQLDALPRFLLRLVTETNWDVERACFESITQQIAEFYSELPFPPLQPAAAATPTPAAEAAAAADEAPSKKTGDAVVVHSHPVGSAGHLLRTVLLPACRLSLTPPRRFRSEQAFREVACVQKLYRIFERC